MPRKLPLAELSIVVNGELELPATLASCGYRGEWHAKTVGDTLLVLAGRLLPDGTMLNASCSHWDRVFSESQLFSNAEPVVAPAGVLPARGQNWLITGSPADVTAWVSHAEKLLREKQLGWLTLYSGHGVVCQWNRAALWRWFTI